jgi:hypothetical protein
MSVVEWARRHTPEAILIPAGLCTGTATALSNVPEIVPFGQELGLGVMGVGYSYIAAYIFNWLVVERPKAKAFRGHYEAAWSELSELMGTPPYMIKAVYQLAGCDELKTSVESVEELQDVLSRIDLAKFEVDRFEKDNALAMLEKYHQNAYRTLAPILYGFEPQVSVAVVHLGAAKIHENIANMKQTVSWSKMLIEYGMLAKNLYQYQEAGRQLRQALADSSYTPDSDAYGNPLKVAIL